MIAETNGANLAKIYLDPKLFPKYPRWEKYCIKRKYGKHPAHYIDMVYTHEPSLID